MDEAMDPNKDHKLKEKESWQPDLNGIEMLSHSTRAGPLRDQSYLKLTDFDLNSFPTDTHQTTFNSTYVSSSEQHIDQQEYNLHLNQYLPNYNSSDRDHVNYGSVNNDDLFSCLHNSQDHYVGEQPSLSTYPGYNMAIETPASVAPIESGNTPGYRTELRCSVPECLQDRKFPSESALRKHEAKHGKPYICQVPDCKHTRFGDKSGLDRHNREVHGSQTHCCPITSCNRHVRGFARKHNLSEHLKRCHSPESPNLAPPSILRQQNHTGDGMRGQQKSYEGESSLEMITGVGGRFREELENLYKKRAEIDVDIEALKRSWALVGENFH
ncbi:hypothetical protein GJ744_009323 [Endocarpon pusillum]|uniref:C2H2-type domain-containing protein n=1 Tax=Endocarpon pusillum TaxID=364733 RepID=A0A8H7E3T4_9EURO|nr:hypothetical protein GJ744_009323 [Endocarpon pusillum]